MIRIVFFGVVLIAVGALIAALVTPGRGVGVAQADDGPDRKLPRGLLGILGVVAVVSAVSLATTVGDGWWLLPMSLWLLVFVGTWLWTTFAPERRPSQRYQLGLEGAQLLEHAERAVDRIRSSQAAGLGWLGDRADLDFRPDLVMIAEGLQRAQAVRIVMGELSALPWPTAEDTRLLEEARSAVRKLEDAARTRVKMLKECAEQSAEIDRNLRDEEQGARIADRRDDVRSRLNAMLYGVELSEKSQPSSAADAVKARVEAFRELKGIIDQGRIEDAQTSKWLRDKPF